MPFIFAIEVLILYSGIILVTVTFLAKTHILSIWELSHSQYTGLRILLSRRHTQKYFSRHPIIWKVIESCNFILLFIFYKIRLSSLKHEYFFFFQHKLRFFCDRNRFPTLIECIKEEYEIYGRKLESRWMKFLEILQV